jgi:hypothetical protein
MKLNKYLPFSFIYFFVNSVALPLGLTYTTMLGPFFYAWILLKRKRDILLPFVTVLLPFVIIHIFITGVNLSAYIVSILNIVLVYLFAQAFYTFLKVHPDPEKIFRKIFIFNFILCIAGIVFYFTPYAGIFWIQQTISEEVTGVYRFKMFTYEASHYAMMFAPLFLFYLLQYLFKQNRVDSRLLLLMIFVPILISFSLGVTAALLAALFITFLLYFPILIRKKRIVNFTINLVVTGAIGFFILYILFPDNAFFSRLFHLAAGEDTSGQGRTVDAFILANKIIKEKSVCWGIGPGELQTVAGDIIRGYYLYSPGVPVAIPNAVAETWVVFGWVGLILRLSIQVLLFFYTKVWTSYYRLLLFIFIFIYQFTGSYITNPAEYVIWVLAFTNVFPQFDVRQSLPSQLAVAPPYSLRKHSA